MVQKEKSKVVSFEQAGGYIAGMIDGEGCVSINNRNVRICNSDWQIVKLIRKCLRILELEHYLSYQPPHLLQKKLMYHVILNTSYHNLNKLLVSTPEFVKKKKLRECLKYYEKTKCLKATLTKDNK